MSRLVAEGSIEVSPRPASDRDVVDDASPARAAHVDYRPDIDGLRAVAVASVVGFHAFPATVKGGFVGVDLFFVISGYLISTILLRTIETGRFTFAGFYARRIRRIFPALAVVLSATLAFGGAVLLAGEYATLGKHVAAGAGFVSNFVLWRESGYFDANADSKVLLHLWSLAIEEQFYIAWPIVLFVAWKRRINLLVVALSIAAMSFACNAYVVTQDAIADFYSPLTRSWELMAGGLLAHGTVTRSAWLDRVVDGRREVVSLLGVAALAIALTLTRSTSPFPGWWALLPVGGAVAIIAAGPDTMLNRHVLGSRPFVALGLFSYPLYLWHWPILSFIRIVGNENPSRTIKGIGVVAAVVLAWLTYRCIERPLRLGSRSRLVVTGLFATVVAIGLVGFAAYRTGGFESRAAANPAVLNAGDIGSDDFHRRIDEHARPCLSDEARNDADLRCAQSRDGPVDLAIVGDSHSESVFIGLAEALPAANVAFYMHDSAPVLANRRFARTFRDVLADRSIRTVVLTSWWALRMRELSASRRVADMQSTIDALLESGKTVYLLGDTPNFSFTPRFCKYASGFLREHRCTQPAADQLGEQASNDAVFSRLVGPEGRFRRLDASRYFCDASNCSMGRDGVLYFRDSNHLSIEGSRFLADRLLADHPDVAASIGRAVSSE